MKDAPSRIRIRLMDLIGLVVGYALAALLVRAFLRDHRFSTHLDEILAVLVYTWLGLAMGGPMVLLLDGRSKPDAQNPNPSFKMTWAETAWLLIGGYWIGLALFVIPSRMPLNPLLGVFPILAVLAMRFFGRKSKTKTDPRPGWTHSLAVIVLITWPIAWFGMIVISNSFS